LKINPENEEYPAFIYIEGEGGEKYFKKKLAIIAESVKLIL